MSAAWLLYPRYRLTVYEKNAYVGGHTNTAEVDYDGTTIPVDTGFIVYNHRTYPNLKALFAQLGVPTIPSNMSFGVSIDDGWLEYASHTLASVFATKRHALNPKYLAMLADILRFNRTAEALVDISGGETLGQFLDRLKMGDWFRRYYLLPMAAAIWSCPVATMSGYPAATFIQFFVNHGLLSVNQHPQWHTVAGGSREYVKRITAPYRERIRLNAPVASVWRERGRVRVRDAAGREEIYDQVVIAAHGDEALAMLRDASDAEKAVLGAFKYQKNRAVLHRDASLMPRRKSAWASWSYRASTKEAAGNVSLTYWMNRLQSIDAAHPLFVTLNPLREPNPAKTFASFDYEHPIFDHAAIAAQAKLPSIQGNGNIWFCGSYARYGFHEDGLMSALDVANRIGIQAPWQ